MVRKSLLVVVLMAIATPAMAQEELAWSSKRPDAQAPFGVLGGRTLEQGEFELTYRYNQLNSLGIWFEDVELPPDFWSDYYQVTPLSLRTQTHSIGFAYGASPELTFSANLGYAQRHREQLTSGGDIFYVTESDKLGDLELAGLYNVYDQGAYRAHLQLGALIPTAPTNVEGKTPFSTPGEEPLPYDMRPGAGTFGAMPGLTLLAQNDVGTVGAQVKGTFFFGTNSRDFAPGDRFEFNGWASYRANSYFSFSARAAYQSWGSIEGADPDLETLRDPGNDGMYMSGSRLDLPVGINIYMPEGTRFAGHRLSLEYIYPASHSYDGPQFGADWGLTAGWQVVF
ncbi:MAG: hypothetical protein Q8N53_02975 [Longimicrobiales bacterium]|nr:hypothetical protein [Longimicrobiales bacterium]